MTLRCKLCGLTMKKYLAVRKGKKAVYICPACDKFSGAEKNLLGSDLRRGKPDKGNTPKAKLEARMVSRYAPETKITINI